MDGFDDLLSSSSRALEANPFADPFVQPRSSSPDPWAAFGKTQDNSYPSHSHEAASDVYYTSTDLISEANNTHNLDEPEMGAFEGLTLNSGTASTSSKTTPPATSPVSHQLPLSPGFRESVLNENLTSGYIDDEIERSNSRQPQGQGNDDLLSTKHASETQASQAAPATSLMHATSPIEISTALTSQSATFSSPLERELGSNGGSYASLALGGEIVGGWKDDEIVTPSSGKASVPVKIGSEMATSPISAEKGSSGQPVFLVSVDDPQKVGDAIRPYILYTVRTKTTSPMFSKPSCSVLRRYSDFLWLYETLSLNNPGVVVPPVPEKSSFGRFENQFIQQRRMALEKCIQKIANHPVLAKDPDLKLFLECDTFALDIKHRKLEIAQDRGGLMSSIGQSITGSKFYEMDDWFDKKKVYLDGLEVQLKALVKGIETVSKQRADLAVATGEFAVGIGELTSSELSFELSHSLKALADIEKHLQDKYNLQAEDDINTLLNTADEYARSINSVRMAFVSRIRCYTHWLTAEAEARRFKQAHEKGRNSGKIAQDRMSQSLSQVGDAERRSNECKNDFEKCSKMIKMEFARFEDERINDFKTALQDLLEGMLRRQRETIADWEQYQELLVAKVQSKQKVYQ